MPLDNRQCSRATTGARLVRVIDIRCRMITQESLAYFSRVNGLEVHSNEEEFFACLSKSGIHTALSPTPASFGLKLEDMPLFSGWLDSPPIYGFGKRALALPKKVTWRSGAAMKNVLSLTQTFGD